MRACFCKLGERAPGRIYRLASYVRELNLLNSTATAHRWEDIFGSDTLYTISLHIRTLHGEDSHGCAACIHNALA